MTNDFFQQQDTAKRNTVRLVILFTLSVLFICGVTYFAFWGVYVYESPDPQLAMPSIWQPALLGMVAAGVSLVIGSGSLYKIAELSSGGGKSVALLVGGQEIQRNTTDLRERRILNVVEEMAIAAGVPVPPVYLLPNEAGINAFAAGHTTGDAIVAVSQGSLDYLTRDELQGVIGHEFSHILNGDMRLNIRLMGLIHGLLVLSLVGYYIMNAVPRSNSSDKDKGSGQLFFVGVALYILGSFGSFFGTLIQAAISRQREFLADASSVQFTRNPEGIGGALKKIGGLEKGSAIENAGKSEVAHMFFAEAFKSRLSGLFESHPPLKERIRRIDPSWDGEYPEVKKVGVEADEKKGRPKGGVPPLLPGLPTIPGIPQVPIPALGLISADDPSTDILRDASREPFGARALVYALLLDRQADIRAKQLAHLQAGADPKDYGETLRLQNAALELPEADRLPLIDLSIPALRQMSPRQYRTFRDQMQYLIDADDQLSLFEYALSCVVTSYLEQAFQPQGRPVVSYRTLASIVPPVTALLSRLAWEGDADAAAGKAYEMGMRQLFPEGKLPPMLPRSACSLSEFNGALLMLREALPALKRDVVAACSTCIASDGNIAVRQSELRRAIAAMLGCPIPAR